MHLLPDSFLPMGKKSTFSLNPIEFAAFLTSCNLSISTVRIYGAQNEAYMCRSAENGVRGLCFNELGVSG